MTDATFQDTIDTVWPDIKAARDKAWMSVGIALLASVALGFVTQSFGWSGAAFTFVGIILSAFVAIWGANAVAFATRPLATKVLAVSGLTETKVAIDMAPLRAAGLVPTTAKSRLDDRTYLNFGSYRTDRAELSLYDVHTVRDREQAISYFGGYVVLMDGLPPQKPLTLLRPGHKLGYKRLRKFMMDHVDPSMRQEEKTNHPELDDVSVFGDGHWNEAKVLSAQARKAVDTFAAINALLDAKTEECLSIHFGPDICGVAITANQSRLTIGGMFTTKAKVTNKVDAALSRLRRSLEIANVLVTHATA